MLFNKNIFIFMDNKKYYPYLILLLYLFSGIYISYYFPISDDSGKYFSVLKEIVNGSDINADIHGGTVRSWFYIFGKILFQFYNWSIVEYRILLFISNVAALAIFVKASHNFLSVFTINVFISLYALTFFNLTMLLDVSYYPITSLLMILGMAFTMFTLQYKSTLYYILSLFCFLIITLLRPNLLPLLIMIFYIGFVKINIRRFYILVTSAFLISTVVIIDLNFFNGTVSNSKRTESREQIMSLINNIEKSEKQLIVDNILRDAEKDLLVSEDFNFVGDDPSTLEKNIKHYYCQQQLNPKYNFEPHHCFRKSRKELNKEAFLITSDIEPYLVNIGKLDKSNVTEIVEESYLYHYRYDIIKDHLKNILTIDYFILLIDLVLKFLLSNISPIITLITLSTFYYFLTLNDKKKFISNQALLFFYPFISISILSLLRYLTNVDFAYLFHSLFFMTIISSIGLTNFVAKYFNFVLTKIKFFFTSCILLIVTIGLFFFSPKIRMNNPYLLVSEIQKDKTYSLRETNVSIVNLQLIGSYVDTIANENYVTDFSGLRHFTKSKPLIGIEMNQNPRFYDSLNFYKCPYCYNEPINNKVTGLLGIEYLISKNKIPAVINFGEVDHSFFRRHVKKFCLAKIIGNTEIWKKRSKENKNKLNLEILNYNLRC